MNEFPDWAQTRMRMSGLYSPLCWCGKLRCEEAGRRRLCLEHWQELIAARAAKKAARISKIKDPRLNPRRFVCRREEFTIVWVKVAAFDKLWALDRDFWIAPQSDYRGFKWFEWFNNPAECFPVPIVYLNDHAGHGLAIRFEDGRHRFAMWRDLDLKRAPVAMDAESVKNAGALGIVKRRKNRFPLP